MENPATYYVILASFIVGILALIGFLFLRSKKRNPFEMHIQNATLSDLENRRAELRNHYEIYRSMKTIVQDPGTFLKLDYSIRNSGPPVEERGLTRDLIYEDAARFRIVDGIMQHVHRNVEDSLSFDLSFDLSCRVGPEEILYPELEIQDLPVGGITESQI
jgi:hypothetical protein